MPSLAEMRHARDQSASATGEPRTQKSDDRRAQPCHTQPHSTNQPASAWPLPYADREAAQTERVRRGRIGDPPPPLLTAVSERDELRRSASPPDEGDAVACVSSGTAPVATEHPSLPSLVREFDS